MIKNVSKHVTETNSRLSIRIISSLRAVISMKRLNVSYYFIIFIFIYSLIIFLILIFSNKYVKAFWNYLKSLGTTNRPISSVG